MPTADNRVTLFCMASKLPKDMQVTWKILGKDGENIISDPTQARDEEAALIKGSDYIVDTDRSHSDKLHHTISTLSFTPVISKHKDMEVFCMFHCDRRSEERSLKCSFTLEKPEVSGPIQMSLGDDRDVLCSVSLRNFYPKDMQIKWSHGPGYFQDVKTIHETITNNKDFTFNVRSECRVPGDLFKDQGYRVRATWNHQAESGQQEVSIAGDKPLYI
ncbi:uncharacterized protein [Eleutherodactylus coqui]|uniref:uncharacterized protein n=1 Tax=Eleutherodactylus coqui TaxID=57060 RepID=UPI00346186B8